MINIVMVKVSDFLEEWTQWKCCYRVSLQIKSEKLAELRKPRNEASYGISEFFRGLRHEQLQSSLPFLLVILFLCCNLKELEGEIQRKEKNKNFFSHNWWIFAVQFTFYRLPARENSWHLRFSSKTRILTLDRHAWPLGSQLCSRGSKARQLRPAPDLGVVLA